MHSTYFIVDFAYNPESSKPLAMFELGDAFASEYPNKKIGAKQINPSQYLIEDLKSVYPGSLLVKLFGTGISMVDLATDDEYHSNDAHDMFNFSMNQYCNSFDIARNLILEIIRNASRRDQNSRTLVLYLGNVNVYDSIYLPTINSETVKFINHKSRILNKSFYCKKTFSKFAAGSSIFPNTLAISGRYVAQEEFIDLDMIERFLVDNHAEYYIIKPAQGSHAEYVHVVKADALIKTMHDINYNQFEVNACRAYKTQGLIIQVCHLSKLLKYKNHFYYAKARAIIRADFSENCDELPKVSIVTAFWQLANMSVDHGIQNKTVIANMDANQHGVLDINAEDWEGINREFTMNLPSILQRMRQADVKDVRTFDETVDNQMLLSASMKLFLKGQYFLPAYLFQAERITYFINQNLDDSRHRIFNKHFIIDMFGLNKKNHQLVIDSDDSLDDYTTRASAILFNKPCQLNVPASFHYKVKQESQSLALNFLVLYMALAIYEKKLTSSTFIFSLIAAIFKRALTHFMSEWVSGHLLFFKNKVDNVEPVYRVNGPSFN